MKEINVEKLFMIAKDEAIELEEALHTLSQFLNQDYEMRLFFFHPLIKPESKKRFFTVILPGAPKVFSELMALLFEKKLERKIFWLSKKFTELVSEKMNVNFVSVRTPYHLTNIEKKLIEELVGGNVYLRVDIDPSLIAGVKLLTNNGKFYDLSINGCLEEMRGKMINA